MHRAGLTARDEPPGPAVAAVGEALREDDQAMAGGDVGQPSTRLGQHRHRMPEGMHGPEDRVGHDLRGHRVVHRLVVQRAVGLDVGQRDPAPLRLPGHVEDLPDEVGDQVRTGRRVAAQDVEVRGPTEAGAVPVGGVRADGDPAAGRSRHGVAQDRSPAGMRARGDARRGDDGQQRLVVTDPLPEVRVQVDPHAHPRPGSNASARTCSGMDAATSWLVRIPESSQGRWGGCAQHGRVGPTGQRA